MEQETLEDELTVKLRKTLLFIACYMSTPLYVIFWLADWMLLAEKAWLCLAIRTLILPICFVSIKLSSRARSYRSLQWLSIFFSAAHAGIITTLIFLGGEKFSGYYAGLNLVALGSVSFLPLAAVYRLIVSLVIFLPYYAVVFTQVNNDLLSHNALIANTFFIFGTLAISMLIGSFNSDLIKKEFLARQRLQDEVKSRDVIIRDQTQTNVRMQLLSRQFSPQVIKAIQDGKVGDIKPIQRQKICVIFVDIEGSTARIVRLDKDDIAKVISMFMDDVMSILLKYDITIDKFLGDGILAFSNHPNSSDDYVERIVDAALEILARMQDRRSEYLEFWKNELNVTIGIDVGYANVGIFGSEQVPRSYTAIGEVVNFAKRLSSEANSNQILISPNVFRILPRERYSITNVGTKKLKGFETDISTIYEVTQDKRSNTLPGIDLCPNDRGVLHLTKNNLGIYVLTCRQCGYVMEKLQDVSGQQKKNDLVA